MKSYYYVNRQGQQAGPITVDNFNNNGITKDTNIWCNGMSGWTRAGDVPELKYLFKDIDVPPVPPVNSVNANQMSPSISQENQCPNDYLVYAILSTVLCCLPAGIVAIVFSTRVRQQWAEGDKISAQKSSEQAKIWCLVSLGCGLVGGFLGFLLGILGAL